MIQLPIIALIDPAACVAHFLGGCDEVEMVFVLPEASVHDEVANQAYTSFCPLGGTFYEWNGLPSLNDQHSAVEE